MNMKAWMAENQKKFEEQTQEAAAGGGEFSNPPDGSHIFQLQEAEITESQSGRMQIKWIWTIVESVFEEWVGKKKYDYDGLDHEKSFYFLGIKMKKFGIDPAGLRLDKLQDTLDILADKHPYVKAKLTTKNDFQNMRLTEVLEDYQPDVADPSDPFDERNDKAPKETVIDVGSHLLVKVGDKQEFCTVTQLNLEDKTIVVKAGKKTYTVPATDVVRTATEAEVNK